MLEKVKLKLKGDLKDTDNKNDLIDSEVVSLNINAYYLALFRLLTLISKHEKNNSSETVCKLKHYCLKYIHK